MGARTGRRRTVMIVLALTLLASCSTDSSPSNASGASPRPSSPAPAAATGPSAAYVALGDSFTAGPGISPEQDGDGYCRRSERDWPTLVAAALDREVTDVSCAGATTSDLVATVASGVVGADTQLVTISSGGNDGSLFLSLIRACTGEATACGRFTDQQLPTILQRTTTDLAGLLDSVRTDAPRATVLLVGYPRIMPTTGTCAQIGIGASDVASVVGAEEALDAALADAARQAGVTYVSARDASSGHDACAGSAAWTNGIAPQPDDGIVFHPNARGMRAVADLVSAAARG